METLTKQQAIEQGYTHCGTETGEYIKKIENYNDEDSLQDFFVCEKDPSSPRVKDEELADLISESVYGGEDFYDEHDDIGDKVADVLERLKVADAINEALSTLKYYHVSQIKLII